jgi:hypothetical protein
MISILRYLAAVILDGDYLNDWLTWVDPGLQPHLLEVGKFIAQSIGG